MLLVLISRAVINPPQATQKLSLLLTTQRSPLVRLQEVAKFLTLMTMANKQNRW